jgi:hypothetical protein
MNGTITFHHLENVILPGNVFRLIDAYLPHNIHNSLMLQEDERQKVITDPNSIMPAAFVSFKTRRGAKHYSKYFIGSILGRKIAYTSVFFTGCHGKGHIGTGT